MRMLFVTLTAFAITGSAMVAAAKAEETVIIKRGHDRDHHRFGRRDRDDQRIYIERHHDRDRLHREHRDRD
jgi:hypothetical protein